METLIMGDRIKNTEKPLRRARIMLVEDDTEIGNWLINKLGESKDETNFKWKKNLKEATEELNNKRIDIIILDLKLPDGNGVGLLKKIKNEKRSVTVYVFSVKEGEEIWQIFSLQSKAKIPSKRQKHYLKYTEYQETGSLSMKK